MTMRLLVDAAHPEETRVVVIKGNSLEDFDYASSTKIQLRGNIYLAKVTRVEPSLQAAFVDYGGNRHGFLAFSEIHPDYYQIPVADREALLAEEAAQQLADAEEDNIDAEANTEDVASIEAAEESSNKDKRSGSADAADSERESEDANGSAAETDVLSADDEAENARRRRTKLARSYKIQEVIKRRQILLVQVVKEERGNKGAALTTYLSLAGRYGVLMPNTARGGGISRKIADSKDRKRLRNIVDDLEVPSGMGLIIRTAGANRSKSEIKRDYEFLLRTWDNVRELTLKSTAPTMVYEEANLIKRAIRDLYSKDVEEVLVEGEDAYKAAKSFMRMLMPSHAKRVQPYRDVVPLYHRYKVEELFDTMHDTEVRLKGGGYIVINPTEALVAIDVNSGKATKERNIEETALRTNLEAAEELARHLRLRDLGGLVVIDFIDMSENKHNRAVERRLKDALKNDRARIQVGRISGFGLLEMSRQRMRPSLFEASSETCPHCQGAGSVRSRESTALHVLRAIETEGISKSGGNLTVYAPTAVAIYILNQKRASITEIEKRYDLRVFVAEDDTLVPPDIRIERTAVLLESAAEKQADAGETSRNEPSEGNDDDAQRGKRRRRGRRGGRRRRKATSEEIEANSTEARVKSEGDETSSGKREAEGGEEAKLEDQTETLHDGIAARLEPPQNKAEEDNDDSPRTDAHDHVDSAASDGKSNKPAARETNESIEPTLPPAGRQASMPEAHDQHVEQVASEWQQTAPGDTSGSDEGSSSAALAADAGDKDKQQPGKTRRGWWRRATD